MTTTPKPRRRWLQFSLRTLMVLVLVACVGMGWFALEMRRARERQQAVEKIEELGASFSSRKVLQATRYELRLRGYGSRSGKICSST